MLADMTFESTQEARPAQEPGRTWRVSPAHRIGSVLDALAVDQVDELRFRGSTDSGPARRAFGGAVAGQAVLAAGRTVPPDRPLHSAHTYFVLPSDTSVATEFEVEPVRDGGAFTTRRVDARQNGRTIFTMIASYQRDEPGFTHQPPSPDLPDAEVTPGPEVSFADSPDTLAWARGLADSVDIDIRFPIPPTRALATLGRPSEAHQAFWLRSRHRIPDSALEQAACLTYLTDLLLLSSALGPHERTLQDHDLRFATVNHTVWFHAPARVDEWLLYDQRSRWAGGARALCHGEIFDRSGRLCATTMQEGLLRLVRPRATPADDAR